MGGTRNTFQRIFRRVLSFDRGKNHPNRFNLIKDLMEDDFSAILERTSIGCNPKIAIALAEEFLLMRKRLSDKNKQIQSLLHPNQQLQFFYVLPSKAPNRGITTSTCSFTNWL